MNRWSGLAEMCRQTLLCKRLPPTALYNSYSVYFWDIMSFVRSAAGRGFLWWTSSLIFSSCETRVPTSHMKTSFQWRKTFIIIRRRLVCVMFIWESYKSLKSHKRSRFHWLSEKHTKKMKQQDSEIVFAFRVAQGEYGVQWHRRCVP